MIDILHAYLLWIIAALLIMNIVQFVMLMRLAKQVLK